MKAILSIKPVFVEKIKTGEKKYEYRRKIFKRDVDSIIVYVSSPIKKVVGELIVEDILNDEIYALWENTRKNSGIDEEFFFKYFDKLDKGYAIKIKEFVIYDKPKKLEDFGLSYPPQAYAYLI